MRVTRTVAVAATAALLPALLGGCAHQAVNKQGAPVQDVTVLRIGTDSPQDAELAFFAAAVDRRSGHRVRVEVERKTYDSETPGGEARLAGDLRSGKVGFGFVPSRDWAVVDPQFQAVQAPFLVSTDAAASALAVAPVGADLLRGTSPYGVTGLALIPGEARRLSTRRPVLAASDLKEVALRINDSAQSAQLMSALGAHPVQDLTSAATHSQLGSGQLAGVETSPTFVRENSYNSTAPYLTSFGLFPKLEILMANTHTWEGLDAADRRAVSAAALDARTHAIGDVPGQEAAALSTICRSATVIVQPSPAALHALVSAAAPAQPQDPAVRATMARIAKEVAGTGAQPLAAPVPTDCRSATTATQATSLHERLVHPTSDGAAATSFPTGVFTVTVSAAQWAKAGLGGTDWANDITFTWTLRPDGTVGVTQNPDFADQGPATGTWTVHGDVVRFRTTQSSDPSTVYDESLKWSYYKGQLHFTVVSVQDDAGRVIYGLPWRKVR